jgi:hypothetical protein
MLWIVRSERETFGFDLNSKRFLASLEMTRMQCELEIALLPR